MSMDPNNEDIFIFDDPEEMAKKAVDIFIQSARKSSDSKETFNVAVSGGSTPRLMHRLLAVEPYISYMPWEILHLFWVDERCVPFHDKASNFGAAKMDMADRVPLKEQHLHPMPAEMNPPAGASKYEDELIEHFRLKPGEFPEFDLIVLGVGEDGHTASLFPGQPALEENRKMVLAVNGGTPNVNRLTITFPVINRASQVMVLISGAGKAGIVRKILQEREANLPIQRVQPKTGDLIWLLDQEAASLLSEDIHSYKLIKNIINHKF